MDFEEAITRFQENISYIQLKQIEVIFHKLSPDQSGMLHLKKLVKMKQIFSNNSYIIQQSVPRCFCQEEEETLRRFFWAFEKQTGQDVMNRRCFYLNMMSAAEQNKFGIRQMLIDKDILEMQNSLSILKEQFNLKNEQEKSISNAKEDLFILQQQKNQHYIDLFEATNNKILEEEEEEEEQSDEKRGDEQNNEFKDHHREQNSISNFQPQEIEEYLYNSAKNNTFGLNLKEKIPFKEIDYISLGAKMEYIDSKRDRSYQYDNQLLETDKDNQEEKVNLFNDYLNISIKSNLSNLLKEKNEKENCQFMSVTQAKDQQNQSNKSSKDISFQHSKVLRNNSASLQRNIPNCQIGQSDQMINTISIKEKSIKPKEISRGQTNPQNRSQSSQSQYPNIKDQETISRSTSQNTRQTECRSPFLMNQKHHRSQTPDCISLGISLKSRAASAAAVNYVEKQPVKFSEFQQRIQKKAQQQQQEQKQKYNIKKPSEDLSPNQRQFSNKSESNYVERGISLSNNFSKQPTHIQRLSSDPHSSNLQKSHQSKNPQNNLKQSASGYANLFKKKLKQQQQQQQQQQSQPLSKNILHTLPYNYDLDEQDNDPFLSQPNHNISSIEISQRHVVSCFEDESEREILQTNEYKVKNKYASFDQMLLCEDKKQSRIDTNQLNVSFKLESLNTLSSQCESRDEFIDALTLKSENSDNSEMFKIQLENLKRIQKEKRKLIQEEERMLNALNISHSSLLQK